MKKDAALWMAIDAFKKVKETHWFEVDMQIVIDTAVKSCHEGLEESQEDIELKWHERGWNAALAELYEAEKHD
jgi:hypothetical protein